MPVTYLELRRGEAAELTLPTGERVVVTSLGWNYQWGGWRLGLDAPRHVRIDRPESRFVRRPHTREEERHARADRGPAGPDAAVPPAEEAAPG